MDGKQKTTPTEPSASESTKIFEKRIVDDPWWALLGKKPSSTKYSMSSKDWKEALEGLDEMMSEGFL